MKISKLFHYLYACIMFLPLLVIPIFAINIINRSPEPITLEQPQYEVVNFNQLFDANTTKSGTWARGAYSIENGFVDVSVTTLNTTLNSRIFETPNIRVYPNNKYVLRINGSYAPYLFFYNANQNRYLSSESVVEFNTELTFNLHIYQNGGFPDEQLFHFNVEFFNLTQIFGYGNEPTYSDFIQYYPKSYYDYTLSSKQLLQVDIDELNDTDIGSQLVYSVYSVTDKYFNVTDLFGFDALQQWFIVNIFHGSVNLGFYIFWNLLTYWLFASIFWLIFDVVIYVPQLVHRWLDKGVIE